MKSARQKRIAIALAITSLAALTGCGKSPTNNPVAGFGGGAGGMGSLPGGCIPITQPISFSGTNVLLTATSIIGGAIPGRAYSNYAGQTLGQMQLMGSGSSMGGSYANTNVSGSTITMNIVPINQTAPTSGYPYSNPYSNPYSGYPMSGNRTANVTGSIVINPQTIGMNGYNYGYNTGYGTPGIFPAPGGYPQQPQVECVTAIAIDFSVSGFQPIGNAYLYTNSVQGGGWNIMF